MGLERAVGLWWLRRKWKRGMEGKEGADVKNLLTKIQGLRSAIIALLLLAEYIGMQTGHGGAVLAYTRDMIAALGWIPKEALFDPTVVGAALLTLWATWKRFNAWRTEREMALDTARATRVVGTLLIALVCPASIACGTSAQLQLGRGTVAHPDGRVVRSYVCVGDDDAARLYLGRPEYAWLGGGLERYLTDARDARRAGVCPCPAPGCPTAAGH